MVAPCKENARCHSVVVDILPEEDDDTDNRSVVSSGGTRISEWNSSADDFDDYYEGDSPHSVGKSCSPSSSQRRAEALEAWQASCRRESQKWSLPIPTRDFEIEAVKEEKEAMGLDVVQHEGGSLFVSRVKAGLVQRWNELHPERRVQGGDRIVSLNGQEGTPKELVSWIVGASQVHLVIRRMNEFLVTIKEDGKLGIDVGFPSASMKVLSVNQGGKMEEWNKTASEDAQVRPGDHIVEVNGFRGKAQDLLQVMRNGTWPKNLVLIRGLGPPSHLEMDGTQEASEPPFVDTTGEEFQIVPSARGRMRPTLRKLPEDDEEGSRPGSRSPSKQSAQSPSRSPSKQSAQGFSRSPSKQSLPSLSRSASKQSLQGSLRSPSKEGAPAIPARRLNSKPRLMPQEDEREDDGRPEYFAVQVW